MAFYAVLTHGGNIPKFSKFNGPIHDPQRWEYKHERVDWRTLTIRFSNLHILEQCIPIAQESGRGLFRILAKNLDPYRATNFGMPVQVIEDFQRILKEWGWCPECRYFQTTRPFGNPENTCPQHGWRETFLE